MEPQQTTTLLPPVELFCDSCQKTGHTSRTCPEEKALAEYFNKMIGHTMEHLAAKHIACPMCKEKKLIVLGDNTPSWDLHCTNCNRKFELKSKALTNNNEPDLYFYGGSYKYYNLRVCEGLHMIIIIYEIDRKTKTFTIKEVFHASNNMLKKSNDRINPIYVEPRFNSTLSNIIVRNKINLKNITPTTKIRLSYNNAYNAFRDKYILDPSFSSI